MCECAWEEAVLIVGSLGCDLLELSGVGACVRHWIAYI